MARISSCSYRLVRESVYNASQGLSQSVPWTIPSHSKKFHFGHNECAQNNKRNPLEQWNVNINVLQATVEIWNRWNFLSFFFCPYLVIYLDEKILRWTQPIRQIGTWQGRIWWSQGGGGEWWKEGEKFLLDEHVSSSMPIHASNKTHVPQPIRVENNFPLLLPSVTLHSV